MFLLPLKHNNMLIRSY